MLFSAMLLGVVDQQRYPANASNSALTSWRSAVSQPSGHLPSIGVPATHCRDTAPIPSRLLFTWPARLPWHTPQRGAPSRVWQRGCARQRLEKRGGGGRAREGVHEVHEPRGPVSTQQAIHHVVELVLDLGQGQVPPGPLPLQPLPTRVWIVTIAVSAASVSSATSCTRPMRPRIRGSLSHRSAYSATPSRPAVSKVAIAKGRLNLASKIEVGAALPTIHADMDVRRTVTAATSAAARW